MNPGVVFVGGRRVLVPIPIGQPTSHFWLGQVISMGGGLENWNYSSIVPFEVYSSAQLTPWFLQFFCLPPPELFRCPVAPSFSLSCQGFPFKLNHPKKMPVFSPMEIPREAETTTENGGLGHGHLSRCHGVQWLGYLCSLVAWMLWEESLKGYCPGNQGLPWL